MYVILSNNNENIGYFLNKSRVISKIVFGDRVIYLVRYKNRKIILCNLGYSKVIMGSILGFIFNNYKVRIVYVVGDMAYIGRKEVYIGDVGVVIRAVEYDVDYTSLGKILAVSMDDVIGEYYGSEVVDSGEDFDFKIIRGSSGSGEMAVFDKEKIVELRDKYKLDFIDDNSGSIYKVCGKFGVLVVAIKGISNFGIKKEEYSKYKEYAREKANLVLERILDREEQK